MRTLKENLKLIQVYGMHKGNEQGAICDNRKPKHDYPNLKERKLFRRVRQIPKRFDKDKYLGDVFENWVTSLG